MTIQVMVCATPRSVRLVGSDNLVKSNAFLSALAARGLSEQTLRAYAYDLVTAYRWLIERKLTLTQLDQTALLDFVSCQQKAGAKPRSINRRLVTLRLFYRFVFGHDLAVKPGTNLPSPHYKGRGLDRQIGCFALRKQTALKLRVKVPHTIVEPLTPEQVLTFIRTLRRYRDLAIVHLLLFCGLRSREVLAIRLSHLCLADRTFRVQGKGNRERMLPLPDVAIAILRDYLRLERPATAPTDYLFVVLKGKRRGLPLTAAGLRRLFRHRRKHNASIRNANAHRFRHTFGADMARAGVRLPLLQRLMGHADPQITLQYINLSLDDIAAEYDRALKKIVKRYPDR